MRVLALPALLLISACVTTQGNVTSLTSEPSGASVAVEGYEDCETPCTIQLSAPLNVTVAKAGYKPQRMVLQPGRKKVHVRLELAAPTSGVEATSLPEL